MPRRHFLYISPTFKSVNNFHEWLRLMFHFSLKPLCGDPLKWLSDWTDGIEGFKSEEICGCLHSQWFHPTILRLTSQETSYLKKRPAGCFLYFIFQDQYLCTKFCWTDHWSSTTSSSRKSWLLSLRVCLLRPLFSAQGHILHRPALLYENHITSTKTPLQMQYGPWIPMICTYSFQLSGLFVLV